MRHAIFTVAVIALYALGILSAELACGAVTVIVIYAVDDTILEHSNG